MRTLVGQIGFFIVLLIYFYFIFIQQVPYTWFDNINLIVHEAGHIVFNPFGEVIGFMGGTIMQLLVPLIFTGYFIYQKDLYATGATSFWAGESFVNVAYYVKDAQTQTLHLIGGTHDWAYLLGQFQLLDHANLIGQSVHYLGLIICLASLSLMSIKIYQNIQPGRSSTT